MGIAERCMITNLSIGCWEGRRLDKAASAKLTENAGAGSDVARVNKLLIAKETFSDLFSARNALRQHVVTHTLPWRDDGQRILMRNMYPIFMEKYGALERAFMEAVGDFINVRYPSARAQASFRMGELFNVEDYPAPSELEHKFYVNLEIDAICEPQDFRVNLAHEEMERIRNQMEQTIEARVGKAMQDVWMRLVDVLEHYVAKMKDPEAIFRDTTVTNLVDLINIMPGLNIIGDPNLKKIRQRIMDTIYGYEPGDLRKVAATRQAAADEAQEIIQSVKGFMSAFAQR
jgi:hypothetical protein